MFFPFTDYKKIAVDHGGGGPVNIVLFTTTSPCMVYFEPSTIGGDYNMDDGGGRITVADWIPANGSLNPSREFTIFTHPSGDGGRSGIIQAGKQIVSTVPSPSNDRYKGTLHVFELP